MNLPRYITQLTKEWIAEVSKRLDAGNCINLKDAGESRIIDVDVDALKLQIGGGGGGSVTSVDSVGPTAGTTNIALNALRNADDHTAGTKAGSAAYLNVGETNGVQEYSSKLDNVQSYIDDNGKVLLSGIHGDIDGHSGNCLVTIDKDGNLGHSENKAYTLLVNGAADTTKDANKIITDKDIGNGLEADSSYNLQVKCATNGGITADTNGIALGGFSGTNKWVKTDGSGKITTTDDIPAVLSDATPSAVAYNGSCVAGSSVEAARADHVHALANISAADVTIGTSNVAAELAGLASDISDVDAVATAAATAANNAATAAASASTTATNAITAANGAVSAAAAAQQTATAAGQQATVAIRDAATAISDAATAQSTADTALANAATAQSTADTASSTATSAQTTANNAKTTADSASETANEASDDVATLAGYFSANSPSVAVCTAVTWTGSALTYTKSTLNFTRGVLTSITDNGTITIDTAVLFEQ